MHVVCCGGVVRVRCAWLLVLFVDCLCSCSFVVVCCWFVWCILFGVSWLMVVVGWLLMVVVVRWLLCVVVCCV